MCVKELTQTEYSGCRVAAIIGIARSMEYKHPSHTLDNGGGSLLRAHD